MKNRFLWMVLLTLILTVSVQAIPPLSSPTVDEGDLVIVEIFALDAINMAGIELSFEYRDSVLAYYKVIEGNFLSNEGFADTLLVDEVVLEEGSVSNIQLSRTGAGGASGDGLIITILFAAKNTGKTNLEYSDVLIKDSDGNEMNESSIITWVTVDPEANIPSQELPTVEEDEPEEEEEPKKTVYKAPTVFEPEPEEEEKTILPISEPDFSNQDLDVTETLDLGEGPDVTLIVLVMILVLLVIGAVFVFFMYGEDIKQRLKEVPLKKPELKKKPAPVKRDISVLEQLKVAIHNLKAEGLTDRQIVNKLVKAGWKKELVEKVMK